MNYFQDKSLNHQLHCQRFCLVRQGTVGKILLLFIKMLTNLASFTELIICDQFESPTSI